MAGSKPHVTTRGPAAQYAGPTEQIIEYSVPDGNATGGLISIRWDPETGAVSVHAYRHDAAVRVTSSDPDGWAPGEQYITATYAEGTDGETFYGTFAGSAAAEEYAIASIHTGDGDATVTSATVIPLHAPLKFPEA